ncbi:MAG: nucleoside monophosphate kinase, partial [Deltaproteobacteria bacterium]|jgi:adenylate kinase|nr:nucleoside monophosphate kinase [Deltaproteobacteria bacterium]
LDGFPRTLEQAKAFDQSLMDSGEKIDHVILLEMSLEGVVKRMAGRRVCRSCGNPFHVEFKPPPENMVCPNCQGEIYQRADDSPLAIQNRLEVFVRDTGPLIPFYAGKRILRRVDGSMSPHEVEAAIFKILG